MNYWINDEKIDELGVHLGLDGQPDYPYAAAYLHNLKRAGILVRDREPERMRQQLRQIANRMIGNERIWILDRLAMECEVEAEVIATKLELNKYPPSRRLMLVEQEVQYVADALYLRRLEFDLGKLHESVRGSTVRRGGRYDRAQWQGERP